jgi:aspartyl-tRNA synthetase
MKIAELTQIVKGKGFKVFDDAEAVLAISVPGAAEYSRKQLDELTEWVRRPQIGASGLVYARVGAAGVVKSSVDKFYSQADLKEWSGLCQARENDLLLVLAGAEARTRKAISELRLEMGERTGLRDKSRFSCLWITDFPLLEWNEGDPNLPASLAGRWHAKHHPFTSPKPEDVGLLQTDPGAVRANAYDMVINGVEVGGGSIRIHDRALQERMFEVLGFSKEEAQAQFGFLMNAFEYGAPPHGGIAFGFDRLCAVFSGADSIRDFIAFPKNNAGRDVMIDAPSEISEEQLHELSLKVGTVAK